MRSHLRLHLPDLNLSVPALCHTSPSSSTSSLPSFSLSLSRSSSKSSSASSVASSSTTAPLTCPPSPITAQILESCAPRGEGLSRCAMILRLAELFYESIDTP
ncbi:hypothetical protein D6D21_07725 [Aureobasidium pullulans]|uniref:Uncharacterized protein n=1 Tax=Aureobasidium pullulans TaxID=5580 RepID=A0AB74ISQ5_AURPU|nr:hypothetical protein D6D21_07725 [Aureobasidium pullulans]